MNYPRVLVLESGHLLGSLLRSRRPERTWVIHQVRSLAEVRADLGPSRSAVLIVEITERFLEVLDWSSGQQTLHVIGVVPDGEVRPQSAYALGALEDLGLLACLPRSRVFDQLPSLVERALRGLA